MSRWRTLPRAAARVFRRFPRVYWPMRRAYERLNGLLPARVPVAGFPGPVHRNDLMLDLRRPNEWGGYVWSGRLAVALVREAVEATGGALTDCDVLDFGCGHGRTVRHFATDARSVTACDLNREAVRFCARAFGAIPIVSSTDIKSVSLGFYDAIWAGSVVTHLSPATSAELLRVLAGHLNPGGVLVVSNSDPQRVDDFLDILDQRWLHSEADRLHEELARTGASFASYPQNPDGGYGLGFQSDEWLDEVMAGGKLVLLWHRFRGWSEQQSVHAWHLPRT